MATCRGSHCCSCSMGCKGGAWGSIRGAGELNCCAEQLENAGEEAGGQHTTPATATPLGVQVVPGGACQVGLCC